MKKNITLFLLPLIVGFVSYYITHDNMDIYATLNTPPFAPKPIVFAIVWTVLYILMGISSIIVINSHSKYTKPAINIYLLSLFFNFIWSPIFFNRRQLLVSLLVIVILWMLVLATIRIYKEIDKIAAILQFPYLIWLIVAFYLNAGIIILN